MQSIPNVALLLIIMAVVFVAWLLFAGGIVVAQWIHQCRTRNRRRHTMIHWFRYHGGFK